MEVIRKKQSLSRHRKGLSLTESRFFHFKDYSVWLWGIKIPSEHVQNRFQDGFELKWINLLKSLGVNSELGPVFIHPWVYFRTDFDIWIHFNWYSECKNHTLTSFMDAPESFNSFQMLLNHRTLKLQKHPFSAFKRTLNFTELTGSIYQWISIPFPF